MYIESPHNARVRDWSQLKTKKGRDQQGLFLVEGLRLIRDLLDSGFRVTALLVDVGSDAFDEAVRERATEKGVPIFELSPKAFEAISDTVSPQGHIAVAALPNLEGSDVHDNTVVLLDGIQDPGNVGTLIRSADAFGMDLVCCGTGTVDPFSPKVVRSSMGGLFRTRVVQSDTVRMIQSWLERHPQGQVVLAAAQADSVSSDLDWQKPTLVMIGSEASGVSASAEALATQHVRIPMMGRADSLNAAVAGSILMYESVRQR